MALSTIYFDPLSPLFPKSPNIALQIVVFCSKHTVPIIIDAHCAKIFLYNLGTRSSLPKQLLGPKLMGFLARRACKNLGPPIYFCNVEARNFKLGKQVGLGE